MPKGITVSTHSWNLERAEEATVTGSSIVRAVRAYLTINDHGEWVQPPTAIHITHLSTHSSFNHEPSTGSLADDPETSRLPLADASDATPALSPGAAEPTSLALSEGQGSGEASETEPATGEANALKETVLTVAYESSRRVASR